MIWLWSRGPTYFCWYEPLPLEEVVERVDGGLDDAILLQFVLIGGSLSLLTLFDTLYDVLSIPFAEFPFLDLLNFAVALLSSSL